MNWNISVMNMTCGLYLPVGSRLARCLAPKPPDGGEKNSHSDHQARIAGGNSHVPEDENIAERNQQHWHHDDVKRAIHTVTSFHAGPGKSTSRSRALGRAAASRRLRPTSAP